MPQAHHFGGLPLVERRAHARKSTDVRCWLNDDRLRRFARLGDLSAGGARVMSAAPPSIGQEVTLTFDLDASGGGEVQAAGIVVWSAAGWGGRGGALGLQFIRVAGTGVLEAFSRGG